MDLPPDPFDAFSHWFAAAEADVPQAEAMTLATVDAAGVPAARVVLFKGFSGGGLRFFTNYTSAKAQDLSANRHAALVFFWQPLHRQVRITGATERLAAAESDAYFASRDRESQLGAWASDQSSIITSREVLIEAMEKAQKRFEGGPVPRPPHWGGYRLIPHTFEFWQGRDSRLHDRVRYTRDGGTWHQVRLAP